MANPCDFVMKVVGSDEAIHDFMDITYSIDAPRLGRVENINWSEPEYENGVSFAEAGGECAHSVYSAMCDGPDTCANDNSQEITSLREQSERLALQIEVFSWQPSMGFSEHLVFINGKETVNETCDYQECWYDDFSFANFEDFKAKFNLPADATEDDLTEEGVYKIGGFKAEWTI